MESKAHTRVLIVFHDTIYNSGGTRSLLDLVDRFVNDDSLELVCLFPRSAGTAIDYLEDKSINIISCRYWYATGPKNSTLKNRIALGLKHYLGYYNIQRLIREKLRDMHIDLVYSNTGVVFAGAWISKALKIPHVWHIREFLDEDHGITPLMGWRKYYRFVNRHATAAIMISEALKSKHRAGIDESKIHVVHDDLSPDYLLKQDISWEDRKYNILFAGTICEGKGQLIAVKALALLKKKGITPKLLIAGSVKERDQYYKKLLDDEIKKEGLEKQVEFLGQVSDLAAVRQQCGIGIVASRSEAFGRVTAEGMLADMVMIGAEAGGTAELITHRRNGFLFPLGDSIKLADIVEYVLLAREEDIAQVRKEALSFGKKYIEGNCANQVKRIFMESMK
ncbi:glycosyltransferase family 4 protein [Enterocloster lavalensis]|uniref:glycosyltransferase family 4 protein n=1 Tax=Enterocloster lavalensis TaxID=460384 RepID=UPI001D098A52|nr:glycosyltransferase family 4 protein [Enterocloster lavalensis]MCB6346978.1 glycosyltransferase family 4 protein [Enterocloster lavalensis]